MDVFLTAFNAVLPTFLLIALGAYADKFFPDISMETLSRLSVYYLIPALTFNALATTELTLSSAAFLALAYSLYLLVLGVIAYLGAGGLNAERRRAVVVTTLFGNTGNMGLPITLFAYGQLGFDRAVVLLVVSLVAMFIAGPTMLVGGTTFKARFRDALKLPPLWATIAGVLMNITGLSVPIGLERGVSLLGAAAIPIMLLSLGIQMRRSWVWEVGEEAIRTTVYRMLLGPLVAFAIAFLLGLPELDRNVLILSAAMPTAVTMFVVAVEVKGDFRGVARSVVATTIVSVIAIMVVLALFPGTA